MLIYVDVGSLLRGRFGSKTELFFDDLSSSVFMLIYIDLGRRIGESSGSSKNSPPLTFQKNRTNRWVSKLVVRRQLRLAPARGRRKQIEQKCVRGVTLRWVAVLSPGFRRKDVVGSEFLVRSL